MAFFTGGTHGYVTRLEGRQGPDEPTLFFNSIQNLTTCTSTTFTWFYDGPPNPATPFLTLSVVGVPTGGAELFTRTLSESIIPFAEEFDWLSVNVPPGNYVLSATIPSLDFSEESAMFEVHAGSDTSCVVGPSPTAPPSTPRPSDSSTPPPASGTSGTQSRPTETPPLTSPDPSPSASESADPVGGVTKPRINTGTIVGIVLGVLAVLIAFVGVFFLLRRRSNRKGSKKGGGNKKGWNGLSSTDSRAGLNMIGGGGGKASDGSGKKRSRRLSRSTNPHPHPQYSHSHSRSHSHSTHPHGHSKSGSTGPMLMTPDPSGGSTEEGFRDFGVLVGGATASSSEEKFGGGRSSSRKNSAATTYEDHDAMALANLPTLHHRARDDGGLGLPAEDGFGHGYGYGYNSGYGGGAGANVFGSGGITNQRRPSYPDSTGVSRSSSVAATSATHPAGYNLSPAAGSSPPTSPDVGSRTTSPEVNAKKANRNSFGGRKRKPVPAYDPEEIMASMPTTTATGNATASPKIASTSSLGVHSTTPSPLERDSSQSSRAQGHYTTRANGSRPGTADGGETLAHKSSFGPGGVVTEGKQLHYLMPDLPPGVDPQQQGSRSGRR
ncbi:hypothetical protein CC1G_11319 [Coprinopsis cinerea okayama7|uniref:Uncharacterized protein n=1 Tax=Coprinopsis cinerea (strain Okayama-7 / 130 / ATCC MYA-4618 / FGSC 9003) TaxID=240176 RepID=A8P5P8_COPC7|nr:hypothetical protein CC1G_11319 [Coprinopsis cinerea okayama7\|eukprot:XP_001838996.1 hypothetical protein CC1G_11319 [Coprinopsis cinerea okayama7\